MQTTATGTANAIRSRGVPVKGRPNPSPASFSPACPFCTKWAASAGHCWRATGLSGVRACSSSCTFGASIHTTRAGSVILTLLTVIRLDISETDAGARNLRSCSCDSLMTARASEARGWYNVQCRPGSWNRDLYFSQPSTAVGLLWFVPTNTNQQQPTPADPTNPNPYRLHVQGRSGHAQVAEFGLHLALEAGTQIAVILACQDPACDDRAIPQATGDLTENF